MTKKILLSLAAALSLSTTQAQNSGSDTTHIKVVNLDEVVISVNKSTDAKKTVSQQVQLISQRQIELMQAQSTADLLATGANIFVQKSQMGGGSPVIRGFEANRILLVIDGVRMNNLIYRSGHLQNIITTDNTILDHAEILYGPSSTIYGSDALGGVIHLFTKKPAFSKGDSGKISINAFTRFGSVNDEFTGHVDVNVGCRKIASLTSLTFSDFGHLRGGENQNPYYSSSYGERPYYVERINGMDSLIQNSDRYLQVQSGFKQYDLLQKVAFRQDEFTTHQLNIQFSNSTDIPRYDRLTDPSANGLRYAEWYYGPQRRLLAAYDFERAVPSSKFSTLHVGVNYQNIEESRHQRRFDNVNLQHRNEKVYVLGANVDLKKVMTAHTIRFGLDAQYNTLISTAFEENVLSGVMSELDTRYPDGDNSMMNSAFYFSHTLLINHTLILTDGIRLGYASLHSTFNDTSIFHFPYTEANQNNAVYSGSIGLISTPSDDLKLSALISTGFRTPNVDDLAKVFESAAGAVIVPNPDLQPEKTVNYEIGITRIIQGRTIWENSLFYTNFFDAIITDEFSFNGQDSLLFDGVVSRVYANQNKGKAYLYGYSSTIRSQCTREFSLSFGLNYTYGRIKTDSSDAPLDHIPPLQLRLQLSYQIQKFSTDFFINYNGWKKLKDYYLNGEDNEQYATADGMPAWYTINIRTSYRIHKLVTLQAGIDNILDTQYRMFASGINAPGRNLIGCIRFNY